MYPSQKNLQVAAQAMRRKEDREAAERDAAQKVRLRLARATAHAAALRQMVSGLLGREAELEADLADAQAEIAALKRAARSTRTTLPPAPADPAKTVPAPPPCGAVNEAPGQEGY